ncbi:RWD domain-containing protein [Pleomassaria siparia CBS 279.74]|uniref:RWD domain-containing protein n=1 Tax=Pleomassaria siparia CBS 279.74 TaxID=1314801 RepID=A0A6G1K1H9_9PLEO|nr:RWD domain-containing protein [Pleomassaria siparia CBS 279.74]
MGIEEQKEEREVLEAIFPEEITDVSETEFRVAIVLDVNQHENDDSEPPTIILNVQYPPDYPDEAPRLDISAPPNSVKHAHLDIQDDKTRLLSSLSDTIEENLGMAMIFTLVSTLKDGAELLISERKGAIQALKDVEAQKIEEEENRKFQGEAVTRERFLAWRDKFRKELADEEQRRTEEKEADDKKRRIKEEKKLTGKELWQQGLVGKSADEDDEGSDALAGFHKLKLEETS